MKSTNEVTYCNVFVLALSRVLGQSNMSKPAAGFDVARDG